MLLLYTKLGASPLAIYFRELRAAKFLHDKLAYYTHVQCAQCKNGKFRPDPFSHEINDKEGYNGELNGLSLVAVGVFPCLLLLCSSFSVIYSFVMACSAFQIYDDHHFQGAGGKFDATPTSSHVFISWFHRPVAGDTSMLPWQESGALCWSLTTT